MGQGRLARPAAFRPRPAVLHRGLADLPHGAGHTLAGGRRAVRPRARRARVLPPAGGLCGLDAPGERAVFAGPGSQSRRVQGSPPLPGRADRPCPRTRRARQNGGQRGPGLGRGGRGDRHRPVPVPRLRPSRPAPVRLAGPLHDLRGRADAADGHGPLPPRLRCTRPRLDARRAPRTRHRPGRHVDTQRVDRRRRRRGRGAGSAGPAPAGARARGHRAVHGPGPGTGRRARVQHLRPDRSGQSGSTGDGHGRDRHGARPSADWRRSRASGSGLRRLPPR